MTMTPNTSQPSQTPPVPLPDRERMELLNELFDQFSLKEQISYYKSKIKNSQSASDSINGIRATLSLLGGVASALVGTLTAFGFSDNSFIILFLVICAVILPGLGATVASLNSLFEWDRHVSIYTESLRNIQATDAISPIPELNDMDYYTYLQAYADASLDIMREEVTQFGNLERSKTQMDEFLRKSQERTDKLMSPYKPQG